jgi:hypothetical protein
MLGIKTFVFLEDTGDERVVSSIRCFDTVTGTFETASYLNGQIVGVDFPIIPGEAYSIYMKQDVK